MSTELKGKRVLLVEDNEMNRQISKEILEAHGIDVYEAEDGEVAVQKVKAAKRKPFDFILMDIMMPNMDGYEATIAIRALENPRLANIPIIAMTSAITQGDKVKALEVGMNAHLSKPVDIPELLATIKNVMCTYEAEKSVKGKGGRK